MKAIKLVLLLVSVVMLLGTTRATTTIIGQASTIDGDTIEIRGERIRLFGIDAPEAAQMCFSPDGANWPCGRRASFALADHIGSLNVTCTTRGKDRWARTLATCHSQSGDLQEWMVVNGWALAFVRYSRDYIRPQERAKQAKLGMWVGSFQAPWDWRKDRNSPPYETVSGPAE